MHASLLVSGVKLLFFFIKENEDGKKLWNYELFKVSLLTILI